MILPRGFMIFCLIIVVCSGCMRANALSLNDLMVDEAASESSSSKRLVQLFDSPLSASVLTREQIARSGATSIPEALRLIPGLLVREVTNGQYEVHIRGFENVPIQDDLTELSNRNSLVMIDGRVVYEYFLGGTFWETLPVSIHDIDKIEVVRGGVSALYGPNAGTGIINIMTKRPAASTEESLHLNAFGGHYGTQSVHIGYERSFQDIQWRLSAFDDSRGRYQEEYYSYAQQDYIPIDVLNPARGLDINEDNNEAKQTRAVSISINNDPTHLFAYDFSYAHSSSAAHKTYLGGSETPFTMNKAESDAFNLKLNYYNWFARLSHHDGEQETFSYPELNHTYQVTQTVLEYQYRRPKLIIRPGIRYDEMSYSGDFIGGKRVLTNKSITLRSEYDPELESKIVMSASADKYNNPDKTQIAYQLSGSHKFSSKLLIRAGLQQAHRSSFLLNSFLDLDFPVLQEPNQRVTFEGDSEANLLSFRTYELGVRRTLSFDQWFETEVFYTTINDFSEFIEGVPFVDNGQTVTPSKLMPIDTKAEQLGLTLNWYYQQLNWTFNSFITLQKTNVKDQTLSLVAPLEYTNHNDEGTPAFFGGVNINWEPKVDWNINSSLYFMDKSQVLITTPDIKHKNSFLTVLNLSLQYTLLDRFRFSFSAKNLVNRQVSQYYFTDQVKPSFVFGLNIEI